MFVEFMREVEYKTFRRAAVNAHHVLCVTQKQTLNDAGDPGPITYIALTSDVGYYVKESFDDVVMKLEAAL